MKKEDYEKQIQELNEQAQKLEKTIQTYGYLQNAMQFGHEFETHVNSSEFGKIDLIEVICKVSGANYLIEPKTPMQMEMPNDPRLFGDLAGKKLKDIEIGLPRVDEPPQEASEPAEKPTLPVEKVEETNEQGSGNYRVDTSGYFKEDD